MGGRGASLADLDRLYFQGSPVELAKAVASLPRVYALSMRELYEQVISDVRDGKAGTIHPELYRAYSENLRKAVSGYADNDLKTQFEANLSRFAAYKAWHATRQLERQLADRDGVARSPEAFDRMARAVLNTFNRYQAAEYNTAVARARTAHQWQQFSQGDNMFLFPNLRWLPSRSANPREAHTPFYNRVWAKTDPFWNSNQPGNLWNCKCDWEETDDPVTGDNPEGIRPAKGLEGNPAETGQIFTDECTYIQKAGNSNNQRRKAEIKVADEIRPLLEAELKGKLVGEKSKCFIDGVEHEVMFFSKGIEEAAQSMKGTYTYWIKNEILPKISDYIRHGQYVQRVESDATHNTNAATVRLKRNTDWFYYFNIKLPDGTDAYINIGHFKDSHPDPSRTDRYYFYTITKQLPSY